jgi:uncharacterized repeat protein (TIGR01451 family)
MKRHPMLSLVVTCAMLLSLVPPLAVATMPQQTAHLEATIPVQAPPEQAVRLKIEPLLLKELEQPAGLKSDQPPAPPGMASYIVYLQATADLRTASRITAKTPRRQAVVAALQETAQRTQAPLIAYLERQKAAGKVATYQSFWICNGLAVAGDLETLLALAARPEVAKVRADHWRQWIEPRPAKTTPEEVTNTVEWNIAKVRAPEVWSALGITGTGVVVGGMDTGVDWTHPALTTKYRGYNPTGPITVTHAYNWFDATGTYPSVPYDGHDHGTHTMGTMVGDDGRGNQIGMAPGARWIATKIVGDDGGGRDSWIHAGFQWMLAPTDSNGQNADPSKAPDIVNNSWGSPTGADETFRPDVAAWLAAGILPVFSAGNSGEEGAGSTGTPGAFPESFAVGATDIGDLIAYFSSRGPSFWEETKPNVSAPGVNVRSSVPGGYYEGGWSGTSMAAPHVSGLAALLLSANPTFTPIDLEAFIRLTARDLGASGPDNLYGWGRIDAYEAVRWAVNAGKLYGAITAAGTGTPLAGATVVGLSHIQAADNFTTTTDATGVYTVSVPAGLYDVTASAFGYLPATVRHVSVIKGFMSVRDLALSPAPQAVLSGSVTEQNTGLPLVATVRVLGTPASTTTDVAGRYTLSLPLGTHSVQAQATGHQSVTVTATVGAGGATADFALPAAPSILLVDADAWFDSVVSYYKWALDYYGYPYTTRLITDTTILPTAADLAAYDVVVWVNPWSSPGYLGLTNVLGSYLDGGGRLFISGQDIGYWDVAKGYAPIFYADYLHAAYRRDSAATKQVLGTPGDLLSGISLNLEGVYAHKKSRYFAPDEVAALDFAAAGIANYGGDGIAGLKIAPCAATYRAVYLAFGYEDAGPRPDYAAVLDRSLHWLTASRPPRTVHLSLPSTSAFGPPGATANYTVTVVNDGSLADNYALSLTGNAWPGTIWNAAMTQILTSTGEIAPCQGISLVVQIQIPVNIPVGTYDVATLQAVSLGDPAIVQAAALHTMAFPSWVSKASLPNGRSRLALAGLDCKVYRFGGDGPVSDVHAYDPVENTWTARRAKPTAISNASAAALNGLLYVPAGYDGYNELAIVEVYDPVNDSWTRVASLPIALGDHATVALDGKLYVLGGLSGSLFQADTYAYDPGTNTWTKRASMHHPRAWLAAGVVNGKIYAVGGINDASSDLSYVEEYDPATNTWTEKAPLLVPRGGPGAAGVGQYLYVAGGGWDSYLNSVEQYDPAMNTWQLIPGLRTARRTLGVAYAGGRLYAVGGWTGTYNADTEVMEFEPSLCFGANLATSAKTVDKTLAVSGDILTYTLSLRNTGPVKATGASLSDYLPAGTTYVPNSITGGAVYNSTLRRIEWTGDVDPGRIGQYTWRDSDQPGGPIYAWVDITTTGTALNPGDESKHGPLNIGFTFPFYGRNFTQFYVSSNGWLSFTSPDSSDYLKDCLPSGQTPYNLVAPFWDDLDARSAGNAYYWSNGSDTLVVAYVGVMHYTSGGPYTFEAILKADGTITFQYQAMNSPLDSATVGVQNSDGSQGANVICNAAYLHNGLAVRLIPSLPPTPPPVITFQAQLAPDLPPFTTITNTATINDGAGTIVTRSATTLVNKIDLSSSSKAVDKTLAAPNEVLNYTLVLRNIGNTTATAVGLSDPIPAHTTYVPDSATGGASYNATSNQIEWQGAMPAAQAVTVTFAVRVNMPLADGTLIRNVATLNDGLGHNYALTAQTTIRSPNLATSSKLVSPLAARPGDVLTYTIQVKNSGAGPATAILTDTIPAGTTYVPGSAWAGNGTVQFDEPNKRLVWMGRVPPAGLSEISFAVQVVGPLPIQNSVTINDGAGQVLTTSARPVATHAFILPVVLVRYRGGW